jgi:hypothetical protein
MHVTVFSTLIRAAMVNKYSELVRRQVRDRFGRFASPSSRTILPPSCQEVGSLSCCRTVPPPSSQEEASSDDSVEMWVMAPPPLARLVAQATTTSALTSKMWAHMNTASKFQLFSILIKCVYLFLDSKIRNKLASVEKELQQVKKDNATLACYINARSKKEEARRKEKAWKKV